MPTKRKCPTPRKVIIQSKIDTQINKKCCTAILFILIAFFALILYISYINHLLNEFIVNLEDFGPYAMLCPTEESNLDHEIHSFYSRPESNTPNLVDPTSDINTNVPDLVSDTTVPDTTVPDNIIRHEQYIRDRTGFSGNKAMGRTIPRKQSCIRQVNELIYLWNQGNEIEKKKLQIALMETGIWDITNNKAAHRSGGYRDFSSRAIASLSMTHYDSHHFPIGGLNGVDLDLKNNVFQQIRRQTPYADTKPLLIHHLETHLNNKRVELAAALEQDKARIKDALSINKIMNK